MTHRSPPWSDEAERASKAAVDALQRFAHLTGAPAGQNVIEWYADKRAEQDGGALGVRKPWVRTA